MYIQTSFAALAVSTFALGTAAATTRAAITICPSYEIASTGSNGAQFTICLSTDFEGLSVQVIRDVPTLDGCVRICSDISSCTNAVYNHGSRICHIKAPIGKLKWVQNANYHVIRMNNDATIPPVVVTPGPTTAPHAPSITLPVPTTVVQVPTTKPPVPTTAVQISTTKLPVPTTAPQVPEVVTPVPETPWVVVEGENIAKCPYTLATSNYGAKKYTTCPGTDLKGATTHLIKKVKTVEECARICSTTTGCVKAVYDKTGLACHIKAPEAKNTLIWVVSKRYSVITLTTVINPAVSGRWGNLIRLPVIPVAAYVVPQFPESSRIMVFSSWGADAFGGPGGLTQFADYNFKSGAVSQRAVANTHHDMFCPGISALGDGRMLISGGSDSAAVSLYDPATNTFAKGPDMKIPRGYQTSVTTSEGKIFELGGSYTGKRGGKTSEIYDPATNAWNLLPGAKTDKMLTVDGEGVWRTDNHAWLFSWKNGSVFQAGPSRAQNWFDTKGTGSTTPAGIRSGGDAMCGVNVMYEPGKILSTGGSQSYTNSPAVALTHITTITEPNLPSRIEPVPSMAYPRGFANGVALPDGSVLVTGGQRKSLVFTDTDGILFPELFNPATKTWTTLAAEAVPRNYHSVSILLPDGTVFSGGGGLCYVAGGVGSKTTGCEKSVDHADGQVFSPPYLFAKDGALAPRPVIAKLSATTVKVGGSLQVSVSAGGGAGAGAGAKLVLVRMGSVTHSINSDQRRVPLVDVKVAGDLYTATLPNDSGILIPGHYYLFAVSATGVPSVAKTVKVMRN
ncbi:related to galactose oxidase precursor [Rhynchosporium secalis]|uniref:Related to galactose oxidase n=1 Tax=Rhynchosporium secalis TaxID=38038 RepID=A0A1E1MDX2_RHYSE|nr:related to galactose oxidase precursor [Rhynchosporium secalis]